MTFRAGLRDLRFLADGNMRIMLDVPWGDRDEAIQLKEWFGKTVRVAVTRETYRT